MSIEKELEKIVKKAVAEVIADLQLDSCAKEVGTGTEKANTNNLKLVKEKEDFEKDAEEEIIEVEVKPKAKRKRKAKKVEEAPEEEGLDFLEVEEATEEMTSDAFIGKLMDYVGKNPSQKAVVGAACEGIAGTFKVKTIDNPEHMTAILKKLGI